MYKPLPKKTKNVEKERKNKRVESEREREREPAVDQRGMVASYNIAIHPHAIKMQRNEELTTTRLTHQTWFQRIES